MTRVLVAYATRHGATAGIAERIASTLADHGLTAQARPVTEVTGLDRYDAVVLGSAAYVSHWLKPAVAFAHRHREHLAAVPVWLFSSGPLGTDLVDKNGNDVFVTSRPKEFDELTVTLRARGERVFFGAYDLDSPPIGLSERIMRYLPPARRLMPVGDFRDWPAIDAWAEQIAADLSDEET
jgi:menaquinone-dependent protoporphyrinogen oxidase